MNAVLTYLLYLVISIGLTIFVGRTLSRSGRVFLLAVFGGNESMATAVSRLVVVGFYLFNLGFVTLTMQTSGNISNGRQAIQVLSVKIGQQLLVLGALHLANMFFFARIRRRTQAISTPPLPPQPGPIFTKTRAKPAPTARPSADPTLPHTS